MGLHVDNAADGGMLAKNLEIGQCGKTRVGGYLLMMTARGLVDLGDGLGWCEPEARVYPLANGDTLTYRATR